MRKLAVVLFILAALPVSASHIVICRDVTTPVADTVTKVLDSRNPADFTSRPGAVIDPDMALLRNGTPANGYQGGDIVERKFWKCAGTFPSYTGVVEMSAGEKALVNLPPARPLRPTCNANFRLEIWVEPKGVSDDEVSVCIREAGGGFAWRSIALEP